MKLLKLNMGLFRVNNYILFDEKSKDIVLIDAGGDFEQTQNAIDKLNGNFKYLLHTHGHMDHIAGDYDLQKHYNMPIYLHKNDKPLLKLFKGYLEAVGMPDYNLPENITFIDDNQTFTIGKHIIKTIPCPGHTQGGVGYLIDNMLFSGDSLFYESIGRTDLDGGNYEQLVSCIKDNFLTLSDNIEVYPGHGQSSDIGHEKKFNQCL